MEPKSIIQTFPKQRSFNIPVDIVVVRALGTNVRRTKLDIQNLGPQTIELVEDEASAFGTGVQIVNGATLIDDQNTFAGPVFLIAGIAGPTNVRVREEWVENG